MAARVNKIRHDEETRAKIQTSQLINRLTDHALGDLKLEPTQVRAIEVLLKKTLPDLSASSVEMSGSLTLSHEDALNELDDGPGTDDQA
ncbi:hypothetical protein [Bradyrhizobium sp. 87]|jgi:hypothetical protein|uniref:hypothetical protein n=1 Tax=Bradyrhizobium sp. 87 TaxID=2782682 RepID=UPI001FF7ED64|nr:hypothetical protein [Bradyrhizobium sp. 87]MCK1430892.1 hypothetical protein [Bradyrhizobium sp. 87]